MSITRPDWYLTIYRNHDIQIEIDSLFGEAGNIIGLENCLASEVDAIFAKIGAASKFSDTDVQDSNAEFGTSGMKDIGTIGYPLKTWGKDWKARE